MDPTIADCSDPKKLAFTPEDDDNLVLEDMYDSVNFDFNLSGVHSDVGNIFENFIRRTVAKAALKKQYQKAKKLKDAARDVGQTLVNRKNHLSEQREALKQAIKTKKQKLAEKLHAPPFLRLSDKIAFTISIIVLCLTEWFILRKPEWMAYWYTFLILPLMVARYFAYHQIKFHYFMLDFCYFVQVLVVLSIYVFKDNAEFFQIVFSMSNGPLLIALVMWKNSLVFHDLDKTTSVFIHLFPALVTFCMRWYPVNGDLSTVCPTPNCSLSFYNGMVYPFMLYCLWQVLYLIKTEVIDREKFSQDCDLMTSVRWLTKVKPHPIYKAMRKAGLAPNPVFALVLVQGVYTPLTLLPNFLVFGYYELHVLYIALVAIVGVWNGASFYFEIFSETYSDRLQRFLKESKRGKIEKVNLSPRQSHAAESSDVKAN